MAAIAALIAIGVELFRLMHAPGLDAFRLTTAGALLLGRVFSPWNVVAYGFGIVAGALLDRCAASAFAGAGSAPDASSAS
jgi:threonine/homoserine efflux transporter RhtA